MAMPAKTIPCENMQEALMGRGGALRALARHDKDIASALKEYGPPPDRTLPCGFATLARIIIGQQISTKAASSVWARLCEGGFDKSRKCAAARLPTLRKCGLSQMKAEYVKGLAKAVEDGTLDIDRLHRLPPDEACAALTALRGIGAWTADNYRLFVLLDMDAWPYNDLALQGGMKILKRMRTRPDGRKMERLGEKWRPWRGAGALMLWHVYAKHRDRRADVTAI